LSVHSSGGGTTSLRRFERDAVERLADRLVGGDAAGRDQRGRAAAPRESAHAGAQPVVTTRPPPAWNEAHRSATSWSAERRDLFGFEAQRGLQARQREVGLRPPMHRPRQREACRVAARGLRSTAAAGIAEAEQLGGLVEGLADGVVDGGAERT
jgi:hypothetical protein